MKNYLLEKIQKQVDGEDGKRRDEISKNNSRFHFSIFLSLKEQTTHTHIRVIIIINSTTFVLPECLTLFISYESFTRRKKQQRLVLYVTKCLNMKDIKKDEKKE